MLPDPVETSTSGFPDTVKVLVKEPLASARRNWADAKTNTERINKRNVFILYLTVKLIDMDATRAGAQSHHWSAISDRALNVPAADAPLHSDRFIDRHATGAGFRIYMESGLRRRTDAD